MKIHWSTPRGEEFNLDRETVGNGRFYSLLCLAGSGIYAHVVESVAKCGFWELVWLLLATLAAIGIVGAFVLAWKDRE